MIKHFYLTYRWDVNSGLVNDNIDGVLHIPARSRSRDLPPAGLVTYQATLCWGGFYQSREMKPAYSTADGATRWRWSYPSAKMQLVYSTALTDWATRWRWSYPSAKMQLVYSTALTDWATRWSWSYPSAKMQLVYSTALTDWATR